MKIKPPTDVTDFQVLAQFKIRTQSRQGEIDWMFIYAQSRHFFHPFFGQGKFL